MESHRDLKPMILMNAGFILLSFAALSVTGQWNPTSDTNRFPGSSANRELSAVAVNNRPAAFAPQTSDFFTSSNDQFNGDIQQGLRSNEGSFTNGLSNSGESSFFPSGGSLTEAASNAVGTPYYGARLGSLNTYQHAVSGDVYAIDDETLLIKRFTYDGQVPDAFLYIGNTDTVQPYQALRLLNAKGEQVPLPRSQGQDAIFRLGPGGNLRQFRWIAVMSILANSNFGELFFPREFSPPKSVVLGPFTVTAAFLPNSVRSGLVTVINDKQIEIQNFFYDGQAPDAYFWIGQGAQPGPQGTIVPFKNSYAKLPPINGQTFTLTLPGNLNVQSINWLAVWSRTLNTHLAYVMIPNGLNVPPSLAGTAQSNPETVNLLDLPNCEVFGQGLLRVRWALQQAELTVELTGRIDNGQYMAFGLSGAQNRVSMVNSDVVVAYWDLMANGAVVQDFLISARQECNGNLGVCPDTSSGGANDIRLIKASYENGYLTVQYKRLLNTGDRLDQVINPQSDTYIAWAIGPLNQRNLPSPHYPGMHATNERIRFGRTPVDNCPSTLESVSGRENANLLLNNPTQADAKRAGGPWKKEFIFGNQTRTFIATIGPAGGTKGYQALYGKAPSNNLVWYINGKMAPELVLRRSETYRFIIYGGNNPRDPSRYHPFYITADNNGGYNTKSKSAQQTEAPSIRAGVTQAAGVLLPVAAGQYCEFKSTSSMDPSQFASFDEYNRTLVFQCDGTQPGRFPIGDGVIGVLEFTPSNQDPSVLYYQCFNHQNMGGKITIVNMYRDFVPGFDGSGTRLSDAVGNNGNNRQPLLQTSRRNDAPKERPTILTAFYLIFAAFLFL